MKILGIDPGYDRLGIAVIEKQQPKEVLIFSECFETEKKLSLEERFFLVGQEVEQVINKHKPDVVALETLFFQKNTKTAMAVAEVRGIIIYLAKKYSLEVYQFGPGEIKVAITGYGKASKDNILQMIPNLISLPTQKTKRRDDELDAIAVALTCSAHNLALR